MLGKQAKVLSAKEQQRFVDYVSAPYNSRYPERDRVIALLSFKAGLRAIEITKLTWGMVTDASGAVGQSIELPNGATKGKKGGRIIPMHPELRQALIVLKDRQDACLTQPDRQIVFSERGGYTAASLVVWFSRRYETLGLAGASSHSGRRTFITNAARKISTVGGSLRDVQRLAGHASLAQTQVYIDSDTEAQRKVVALI